MNEWRPIAPKPRNYNQPLFFLGALKRTNFIEYISTAISVLAAYAASLLAGIAFVVWISLQLGALGGCHPDYLSEENKQFREIALSRECLVQAAPVLCTCLTQTVSVLPLSLAMAASIGLLFVLLQSLVSKWLHRTSDASERDLKNAAHQLSTLDQRLPPTVFLKPIGDEAALALTWGSAMAALIQGAFILLFYLLQSVRDLWTRVPRLIRGTSSLLFTVFWSLGTAIVLVNFIATSVIVGRTDWNALNAVAFVPFSRPWGLEQIYLVAAVLALLSWTVRRTIP